MQALQEPAQSTSDTGQPVASPQFRQVQVVVKTPFENDELWPVLLQLSGHRSVSPVMAQPLSPQTPLPSAHVHVLSVQPLGALNTPPSLGQSTTAVPLYPLAHATAPSSATVVPVTVSIL